MKTVFATLPLSILMLASLACAPALADEAPAPANRYAASIAPGERFEAGVLAVERHGKGGTPVILVPGLAGGAWAWQDTLRRLGLAGHTAAPQGQARRVCRHPARL